MAQKKDAIVASISAGVRACSHSIHNTHSNLRLLGSQVWIPPSRFRHSERSEESGSHPS